MNGESLIADRFVFIEESSHLLGRGGMGEVYRGHDRVSERPVAIKVLRDDRRDANSKSIARFVREGELLRELAHPNVVQILASERSTEGKHLLVMEYVEGGSLRELLGTRSLSVRETLVIALELADALARVHHLGVVHRDIKPDNVLITAEGIPKLTDFGIAHLEDGSRITAEGAVVGTLSYLSPEACEGAALDARSDVWSFGVMLYEMLTGHLPFRASTAMAVVGAILSQDPPALARSGQELPEALSELVMAMLVKDRGARLARMRQIGSVLELLLAQLGREEASSSTSAPSASASLKLADTANVGGRHTLADTGEDAEPASTNIDERVVSEEAVEAPAAGVANRPRAERIVLDKVRRHWISGVLMPALVSGFEIPMSARLRNELIEHPWRDSSHDLRTTEDTLELSDGRSLLELYHDVDRALLILGVAGSGKSTSLLRLTRALLQRAEADTDEPIPVVLNLGTWTPQADSLHVWIIEELVSKYQIPRALSRTWLEEQRLTLILDELDGVAARSRARCISAINDFRRDYGLLGLVVVSRFDEYCNADKRLRVGGAVELLPVSDAQLEAVLDSESEAGKLDRLAAALARAPKLRELARTPLMFSLMRELYINDDGAELNESSDEQLRDEVLRRYVEFSLSQDTNPEIPSAALRDKLSSLARLMSKHDQRVFMIEGVQPSWLPRAGLRWLFYALSRLGLVFTLAWVLAMYNRVLLSTSEEVVNRLPIEGAQAIGLPGVGGQLLVSVLAQIVVVASVALFEAPMYHRAISRARGARPRLGKWTSVVLRVGLAFGVTLFIYLQWSNWAQSALMAASTVGVLALLVHRRASPSFATEIEPVEAMGWAWRQAWPGLGIGLIVIAPAVIILLDQSWRLIGYTLWAAPLFFFLIAGLRKRRIEPQSVPNQGMRSSLRNAAIGTCIITAVECLAHYVWWGSRAALDISIGLPFVCAMVFGLFAAYEHGLVRVLLASAGQLPLRLRALLENAVARGLMRQVGGGYMFIHPLIQEYLEDA